MLKLAVQRVVEQFKVKVPGEVPAISTDLFRPNQYAQAALPLLGMQSGASMIFRLDMNGDGQVSVDEFVALSNTLFLRDVNRDGVLTLVEVKTPPVDSYVPVSAQKNAVRESVSTR